VTSVIERLDAFKRLGVGGVVLGINRPRLLPQYCRRAGQYLQFDATVADAAWAHGFIGDVELGHIFQNGVCGLLLDIPTTVAGPAKRTAQQPEPFSTPCNPTTSTPRDRWEPSPTPASLGSAARHPYRNDRVSFSRLGRLPLRHAARGRTRSARRASWTLREKGSRVRKAAGLWFATSSLVPAVVSVAAPAGSAVAKGPTCKTFVAAVTIRPALPRAGVKVVVTATVSSIGRLGGCSGGGVTGAAFTDSYRYQGNCTTFISGKGGVTTPGPSSISWSNGKSSSATTTATLLSKAGVTPVVFKLTSRITTGQFAGRSTSGAVRAVAPAGSCTKFGLAKATLTGTGQFTFK
jgi:hypothetical protein